MGKQRQSEMFTCPVIICCITVGIATCINASAEFDKTNFPTAVRSRLQENLTHIICPSGGGYTDLLERSETIIDKSLFIKAFLNDKSKAPVFLYPKSWGKTTMAYMLKTFFEAKSNGEGVVQMRERMREYRYFLRGNLSTLVKKISFSFAPLISKSLPVIDSYMRKYPVIFVDFRRVFTLNDDSPSVYECFKNAIAQSFRQHSYMSRLLRKKTSNIRFDSRDRRNAEHQRKFYEEIVDLKPTVTENDLTTSLLFLSEILRQHYYKDVIIIINEYDRLITDMYLKMDMKSEERTKFEAFFTEFLTNTFLRNYHLHKGAIFGEVRLECLVQFPNFRPIFPFFGFVRAEIEKLFYHRLPIELRARAHRWYGGYREGSNFDPIYTCGSIAALVNEKKIDNYWERNHNTTFLDGFVKCKQIRIMFEELLFDNPQRVEYIGGFTFTSARLVKLRLLMDGNMPDNLTNPELDTVMNYLKATGYLTSKNPSVVLKRGYVHLLGFPNFEIEHTVMSRLASYYSTTLGDQVNNLVQSASAALLETLGGDSDGHTVANLEEKFSNLFRYLTSEKKNDTLLIQDNAFVNDVIFLMIIYTKQKQDMTLTREGVARHKIDGSRDHSASSYLTDWLNEVITELKFNIYPQNGSNLAPTNVTVGFKIKHYRFVGILINETGEAKVQFIFKEITPNMYKYTPIAKIYNVTSSICDTQYHNESIIYESLDDGTLTKASSTADTDHISANSSPDIVLDSSTSSASNQDRTSASTSPVNILHSHKSSASNPDRSSVSSSPDNVLHTHTSNASNQDHTSASSSPDNVIHSHPSSASNRDRTSASTSSDNILHSHKSSPSNPDRSSVNNSPDNVLHTHTSSASNQDHTSASTSPDNVIHSHKSSASNRDRSSVSSSLNNVLHTHTSSASYRDRTSASTSPDNVLHSHTSSASNRDRTSASTIPDNVIYSHTSSASNLGRISPSTSPDNVIYSHTSCASNQYHTSASAGPNDKTHRSTSST